MMLLSTLAGAQTIRGNIRLTVNSEDALYAKGDTVRVFAEVSGPEWKGLSFRVMHYCTWEPASEKTIDVPEGKTLLFEEVADEPMQYVFELTDGEKPKDMTAPGNVFAGVAVAPELFKPGYKAPSDWRRYWRREIRAMRRVPMDPKITKQSEEKGCEVFHVELACPGPASVNAYVAHPKGARPHSLPIVIYYHAAGMEASHASRALEYATCVDGGALSLDINAHGMLDDQPKEYYDALLANGLKGYPEREPLSLEDYYFKWMMLRAVRALDYLKANPLWDGKHIVLVGTSQGGYQSAFVACADRKVSAIVLTCPAGIGQGDSLEGRTPSWPKTIQKYPESSAKVIPYLDPACMLRRSRADIWCEIGMFDYTCPAANLFAALNTVKTRKTVVTFQRGHKYATMPFPDEHKPVKEEHYAFINSAANN